MSKKNKKKSTKNSGSNFPILVVAMALVGWQLWKMNNKSSDTEITQNPTQKEEVAKREVEPSTTQTELTPKDNKMSGTQEKEQKEPQKVSTQNYLKDLEKNQNKTKSNYLDLIQIDIDLPKDLRYSIVDSEDDIAIIYGKGSSSKEFAVLATTRDVTVKEGLEYLAEHNKLLPMVDGYSVPSKIQVQRVAAPNGSGFSSLGLIQVSDKNGEATYAAIAKRNDKKGSYMFLIKADNAYFDANEDYFDKLLDSLKVR